MHIQLYVVLTNFVVSVVMFFRFVTAGDIRTRADFFEPFITGLSNTTVDQVCIHAYYVLECKPLKDIIQKFPCVSVIYLSISQSFCNKNLLL